MNPPKLAPFSRVHFVGIAGVGMSAIADVLIQLGYGVSGSDLQANGITRRLTEHGAVVFDTHCPTHIRGADLVIKSSAIARDNPELLAAHAAGVPVWERAEMLAQIMNQRHGIAVTGTHGKTTTSSLIASIFCRAGLDPTFIVGGLLNGEEASSRLGQGEHCIAEADESDASFLYLRPKLAVMTNIAMDHVENYAHNFDSLRKTFLEFLHRVAVDGKVVVCVDDPVIRGLMAQIQREIITYGFHESADFRAIDYQQTGLYAEFSVVSPHWEAPLPMRLHMPGEHNVQNAVAAMATACLYGVQPDAMQDALESFQGVGRRFQLLDQCQLGGKRVTLIDDYGHHPDEIAATLAAARRVWPTRRVLLAFQPHRYTRTQALFDDFITVLNDADALLLLDIFGAGESPISGAEGRDLYQAVQQVSSDRSLVHFVETLAGLPGALAEHVKENDVILLQGAGDIGTVSKRMAEES